jgi:predicted DNA-binding protein (MmcQ/YjbR family)
MIELGKISGIGEYETENRTENQKMQVIYKTPGGKAFLVDRGNTIEVRSERNLAGLLREKYESVMESRYFGKGGIEVVMSGQLSEDEMEDLVRLSYNLTKELR